MILKKRILKRISSLLSKIDNIKWLIVVKECHRCQILLKISICSDPKVQYFFSHEEHPQQPWLTTRETLLLVSLAPCSSCWFSTCFWPQGQFHCRDLFGKISVEYNVWTEQRRIRIFQITYGLYLWEVCVDC